MWSKGLIPQIFFILPQQEDFKLNGKNQENELLIQ